MKPGYDKETQYLTPDGWKNIDEYNGELIAQWEESGKIRFIEPLDYTVSTSEKMYYFWSQNALDMVLSENSKMIVITSKGNINRKTVKELLELHNRSKLGYAGKIITTFKFDGFDGLDMTDDEIRLHIAFCADGTIKNKGRRGRFNLKRQRKKERIRMLFQSVGVDWYEHTGNDGYTQFYYEPENLTKDLTILKRANKHQLRIIADELQLWDGDVKTKLFRTTIKYQADFAQYVFMSTYGNGSNIIIQDYVGSDMGNGYTRKSICYIVSNRKSKYISLKRKENNERYSITEFQTEKMYNFRVLSGNLVLRRNNRVFVSGDLQDVIPSQVPKVNQYDKI